MIDPEPKTILITGASSGIGEALARRYAAAGVRLLLTGRDDNRLARVAESCRSEGSDVETAVLDVIDAAALADWIRRQDEQRPLDLVVANAGISAGSGDHGETESQARRIFEVNLDGVLNTLFPAIEVMRPRRRGQLAIMSSLAAFRGFPGAPAYCASKAAVRIWGEALRGTLAADGIGLSVICPGFVRSRMTAVNRFPMPFLMDGDKAARIIQRGLARDKARIAFPWPLAATLWLLATLPPSLTDYPLRRLPAKH